MLTQVSAVINPITREIAFEQSGVSSIEFDGGLWTINFKMPNKFGQNENLDFTSSNFAVSINYSQNDPVLYDDGYTDYIDGLEIVNDSSWPDGKYVRFSWVPPLEASKNVGWVYFNVVIRNRSDNGVWSTKTKKLRISPRVTGGSDSSLSPSQSSKIDNLLDKVNKQVEDTAQEILDDSRPLVYEIVTNFLGEHDVLPLELESILSMCHPIGSYYYSDDPTNPGRLFGGVWEDVEGVFLLASQGSVYPAGSTGGDSEHEVTISSENIPSHTHTLGITNSSDSSDTSQYGSKLVWKHKPVAASEYSGSDIIKSAYSSSPTPVKMNTMPPYRAVYCWRRTA